MKIQHALGSSKKFRLKESTKPDVDAALFQWFTWNSDNSNFLLIQSFCWDIEIRIMWTTLYNIPVSNFVLLNSSSFKVIAVELDVSLYCFIYKGLNFVINLTS